MQDSLQLAKNIAKKLDDKKGKDIVLLKVKDITLIADYFVIVTGTSTTHIQSLAENLISSLKEEDDFSPLHKEGLAEGNWILLDYDSVLVHIFLEDTREFYNLERLWGEAEEITL
ncbi:ribosome silencing factor [Natranaerobius thermophilus]|uniref:Ribosomal silencing factor RsfS n=1 Tax=Natranaerobius thermophilus (strain ATCC BAA-1301 / DSM 18059 / JW/NM-WN-LF) TaxID=457570 RepID=B2A6C1_NATTJ|nr:ribosome silencing factor [Natranaerobius thermophilus]ACB84132.1 iojap-like protein [Natranaerobius thermophilus JW/NM-WN-LF]